MSTTAKKLESTVSAMRPVLPAKNFEISKRFYIDLGFAPCELTDGLIEMRIGVFRFLLQDYYVKDWADNFAIHLLVSDVDAWWDHIASLDLPERYGVKIRAPQREDWGRVAGVVDPSGVLWRFAESFSRK
jgi:hypothetical protein